MEIEVYRMTRKELLDILQTEKTYLAAQFGLVSIGLFGSYAKGSEGPDSDIDLLVELKDPKFDCLVGIKMHLENILGRPVDITRKRPGLSERFLKRVENNICYA
ncbi:MAG: toxin-antitoxin system toxin subunit [Desulfobacteraceae bacterium CG2_30_51_40]|jgi:predicted nucleotidyltransferase|nr:MAG: toxin-antitoxin system toxin subunit [Desulfobacteraceae bacterium CG2_30_51_40]